MAKSRHFLISNFLSGFGAAHNLLANAIESNTSFTEQVCLSATLIDGLLRLSLVMQQQLDTRKGVVDPILLFQSKRQKKFLSERIIYRRATENRIITKAIEKKLNLLHNKRNIIIHRYLISDIKTKDVILISRQYIRIYLLIKERHRGIHDKLIEQNIGMAKHFIVNPSDEQIQEHIMKKHL
ncbi:hypothetical protein [Algoriphagus antarcticus]|uniref:Uncharacterized protein n=1 Tax=Algoriphagus antarcticus TaxID=238540 RepID=A0A3E0DUZ6_9BACT|nr:hypothetical protein [Algoriphagus antarcticus]REG88251.1 hypothetical protein C8N25_11029 [Algoriphagus antarcticus]